MRDASRQIKARSLFTLADTSDGALSDTQFAWAPGRRARAGTQLPDLLTVIPVVDDQVEYVRVSSRTSAATVAGATVTAYPPARQNITTGATGLKPKGGIVFAKFTEAVRTIARGVPATTRVVSDAPQLRAYINEYLGRLNPTDVRTPTY